MPAYCFMHQVFCFIVEKLITAFVAPTYWDARRQFDSRVFLTVGKTVIHHFGGNSLASAFWAGKVSVTER